MEEALHKFLKLNGLVTKINSDSIIYKITIDTTSLDILNEFYENSYIENIKSGEGKIIAHDEWSNIIASVVFVEFVTAELRKAAFYLTFADFTIDNRFEIPSVYYISELEFLSTSNEHNDKIKKYEAVTSLINRLETKARFVAEEYHRNFYLIHDTSFLELPVENITYEDNLENDSVILVNQYIENIDSYGDKKTIFYNELIDFLANRPKLKRLDYLISNFSDFYERCNISFDYYLSNFSFNKIKLELDNSVLEHSKNIRAIINESQSKLVAIPAAFVLGVSQINYSESTSLKNILIVFSAFLFSYILSIFIKNQQNALDIVEDNVNSFKINYKQSKTSLLEDQRELLSLLSLINSSYKKTELELVSQRGRLKILQVCNWSISIILLISILGLRYRPELKEFWQQLEQTCQNTYCLELN